MRFSSFLFRKLHYRPRDGFIILKFDLLPTRYLSKNLKGRDHSEDLGVEGRIILLVEWILGEVRWEGVDWTCLAQDRDQWRAVVNTAMCLQVA